MSKGRQGKGRGRQGKGKGRQGREKGKGREGKGKGKGCCKRGGTFQPWEDSTPMEVDG